MIKSRVHGLVVQVAKAVINARPTDNDRGQHQPTESLWFHLASPTWAKPRPYAPRLAPALLAAQPACNRL